MAIPSPPVPDIENEVFTAIATPLRSKYSGIFITGDYAAVPPTFPAISIVETDNYAYQKTLDTSGENHAQLMYEVNVYSDSVAGKKSQCKAIMADIDGIMHAKGFMRIGRSPLEMPNMETKIYRMVARYRTVVDGNGHTYRR